MGRLEFIASSGVLLGRLLNRLLVIRRHRGTALRAIVMFGGGRRIGREKIQGVVEVLGRSRQLVVDMLAKTI